MKNNRADALSLKALELLESDTCRIVENNTVAREFSGYISSFAQTIVQSGAGRAVQSFSDTNADTAKPRHLLVGFIYEVLRKSGNLGPTELKTLLSCFQQDCRVFNPRRCAHRVIQ